jgi:UDP-N-acetylglucosamine acyltransferase
MNTSLTQDVPPFLLLSGNPAAAHGINVEGLKRRGFSREQINAIRNAYKLIYKSGHTLEEAKAALEAAQADTPEAADCLHQMREFLNTTTRGIVR